MESELAIDASREAIKVCLMVGGPILAVALIVGLLMGVAQAMSHIQDQALATIPKILAIFAVVGFALPWLADQMIDFSKQQFSHPMMVANSPDSSPLIETESSGVVRSLLDADSNSDDSYYPQLAAPRFNPTSVMKKASFQREKLLPKATGLALPVPEVWNPPAVEKTASPFILPSYRFSRRPDANTEG